jgi:uncharacterized protein
MTRVHPKHWGYLRACVVPARVLLLVVCCSALFPAASYAKDFQEIEWVDLIPAEDLDALMNPPDYIMEIADGSLEDQPPGAGAPGSLEGAPVDRYQQALQSTTVIKAFDGKRVRIPGFVVPLTFDDTRLVNEFFIVPYFGACLHSPPPPPNQIIYGKSATGVSAENIYEPFWFTGTLSVGLEKTEMGTAAYRMVVDGIEAYVEE